MKMSQADIEEIAIVVVMFGVGVVVALTGVTMVHLSQKNSAAVSVCEPCEAEAKNEGVAK